MIDGRIRPWICVQDEDLVRTVLARQCLILQGTVPDIMYKDHVTRPIRSSFWWRLAWNAMMPVAIAALRLDLR
jgi:hypothetical protein